MIFPQKFFRKKILSFDILIIKKEERLYVKIY